MHQTVRALARGGQYRYDDRFQPFDRGDAGRAGAAVNPGNVAAGDDQWTRRRG